MISRAMLDFQIMLDAETTGPFFRNLETIKDLHDEQKRLGVRLNIFYAITFIAALLVISNPLSSAAKISVAGVEVPISSLPQQVIAIMMAVAFSMYGTLFASFTLLTAMNSSILRKEGLEGFHFIAARYDASVLWGTLMTPRSIGYSSPVRHRWIAYLVLSVSVLSVTAHAVVIAAAAFLAFWAAYVKKAWLLAALGGFSSLIVFVTIFSLLISLILPLPFRIGDQTTADQPIEP